MTNFFPRHRYPSNPAALILGGVAVVAFGLHPVLARIGAFGEARLASDSGQAGSSTPGKGYPRIAANVGERSLTLTRPAPRIGAVRQSAVLNSEILDHAFHIRVGTALS